MGMNDPISIKGLPWFIKIIAAIIGAIFALTLSGDIDMEGRLKITTGVIIKFAFSVAISIYGGAAFIEYFNLTHYSHSAQGVVMLFFAVFGLLFVGILYQSFKLMDGKKPSELISEIKAAFTAIFK
ncbi:hypothetical protein F888_03607 [Acinetobacter courvalinii]|uniref:Uncharacterized protein n=2 Tax=Acinetobacter courvalinii TaxID=280147 RepID=N9PQD4_9GAMM|nr:hypothetical protein F888_03607 [Acinetobacter courvalinii]